MLAQRARSLTKPSASTLNVDMSAINRVINDVNAHLDIAFDNSALINAGRLLRKSGQIKGSGEKERRLRHGEWKLLLKGIYATKKNRALRQNYTLILRLYISTALRCSELLSLTWEDVDIENSTINLVILKQRGKRKGLVKSIPMLDKTKKLFLKLRPHDFSLKEPVYYKFTSVGSELYKLVTKSPNEAYLTSIKLVLGEVFNVS